MKQTELKLITITDVSKLLNIKVSKIRSMIFYCKIPYIKIGRQIRFNEPDLIKWVNQCKNYNF